MLNSGILRPEMAACWCNALSEKLKDHLDKVPPNSLRLIN